MLAGPLPVEYITWTLDWITNGQSFNNYYVKIKFNSESEREGGILPLISIYLNHERAIFFIMLKQILPDTISFHLCLPYILSSVRVVYHMFYKLRAVLTTMSFIRCGLFGVDSCFFFLFTGLNELIEIRKSNCSVLLLLSSYCLNTDFNNIWNLSWW